MNSAWSICVSQLLTHKPQVAYADMKAAAPLCSSCGEDDPAKFYKHKPTTCKACRMKKQSEWREGKPRMFHKCANPKCGRTYETTHPQSKTCSKACQAAYAAYRRRLYRKNGYGGKDCGC